MTKLQVAVIGLGGMGYRHIQAIHEAGLTVGALCDRSESALEKAGSLCVNAPRPYTNWQDLLTKEATRVDALVIATNGPSHAEITIAAAKSGISHILCEKPMATNGRDTRLMAEICKGEGVRLAIHLPRRFMDRFRRLKKALDDGIIGQVSHFNLTIGAGGIGCAGTHFFDLVTWLLDEQPVWVAGITESRPAPNVRGVQFLDPGGKGIVGYGNGQTAFFELSETVPIGASVHIAGSEGFLTFDAWRSVDSEQFSVFVRPQKQRHMLKTQFVIREPIMFDSGDPPDLVQSAKLALEDLVGDHKEDTVSAGIMAVDTVMAFHLSARENWKKIALPLEGDQLEFDVPIT